MPYREITIKLPYEAANCLEILAAIDNQRLHHWLEKLLTLLAGRYMKGRKNG